MNIKSFALGFLASALIFTSTTVYGASLFKTIDVVPNTIKVMVDGHTVESDNFLYNNTTYVPIRNIATALGEKVDYEQSTSTAYIGDYVSSNTESTDIEKTYDLYIYPPQISEYEFDIEKSQTIITEGMALIGDEGYVLIDSLDYFYPNYNTDVNFMNIYNESKKINYNNKAYLSYNKIFYYLHNDIYKGEIANYGLIDSKVIVPIR